MGTSNKHTAAPIFVVGSPRSGTSILTWCLGQHPNILPTEESDWLGPFAEQVGAHYAVGSARGERSQLSALGVERADFFRTFGDAIDAIILGQRKRLEQLNWNVAVRDPAQVSPEFAVARSEEEPKARWVDGTPEYSMYICGLHKLFPAAKFVHILRDADEVVESMLAFRQADGSALVEDVEAAYAYWLRTTEACVQAAQALGGDQVYRLRHADLVATPERVLHELFEFLGEPFGPDCLAPLSKRINSSFAAGERHTSAHAGSAGIERARQLSADLLQSKPLRSADAGVRAAWERAFDERMALARNLRRDYRDARQVLRQIGLDLEHGTDWVRQKNEQLARAEAQVEEAQRWLGKSQRALAVCGVMLVLQFALATALLVFAGVTPELALYWLAATATILVYAWLRRAGLRHLWQRAIGAIQSPSADQNRFHEVER